MFCVNHVSWNISVFHIYVDEEAKEARLEIEESPLEVEVDTVEVALFLACSMSQEEIDEAGLTELVHRV